MVGAQAAMQAVETVTWRPSRGDEKFENMSTKGRRTAGEEGQEPARAAQASAPPQHDDWGPATRQRRR